MPGGEGSLSISIFDQTFPSQAAANEYFQQLRASRSAARIPDSPLRLPGLRIAPRTILSKGERLMIFNQRLIDAPAAKHADEAFQLLAQTMDDVEDAFSGTAKVDKPGLKDRGRMYPPSPRLYGLPQ